MKNNLSYQKKKIGRGSLSQNLMLKSV